MNDNDRHLVKIFLYGLDALAVDDDGLAPERNDIGDVNALALLSGAVKWIAANPETPEHILLYNLTEQTERLLVTLVAPADGDVVKDWLTARAEVVNCQLGGL